jgi:hypothetical protein
VSAWGFSFVGRNKNGVCVTGSTTDAPATFVQRRFDRRWRELEMYQGDVVVGAIETRSDGLRVWWAES